MTSRTTASVQASAPTLPLVKEKQKEVRFDKSLKKKPSYGLKTPFCLDIMAQLVNILACITLHELLRISKKMREALRDVLADSESFLTQVPSISTDDNGTPYPQCHLVSQQVSCITFTLEDILLRIINMIDPCITWGISVLLILKGLKSTRDLL